MSELFVLAVRDSAMKAFARPMFVPTVAVGIRSFTQEVNRADRENPLYAHTEDFELHLLGTFDEETGIFKGDIEGQTRLLTRAKDVKNAT